MAVAIASISRSLVEARVNSRYGGVSKRSKGRITVVPLVVVMRMR